MGGRKDIMLLDTCALLWLAQGGGKLTSETCREINDAAVVYVSAISGFEIGIKHKKDKLRLPVSPCEWFTTIIDHHDLTVLPLDLTVCIRSVELASLHSDPCDRFIIATAELHNLKIVTRDSLFSRYGVSILC